MEIRYSGKFEKKQYIAGVSRVLRPKDWVSILRALFLLLYLGLLIGMVVVNLQGDGLQSAEIARLARHGVTFLVAVGLSYSNPIRVYRMANRLWKDPATQKERWGAVSSVGVMIYSHLLEWQSFVKKDVGDDLVALMTVDRMVAVFPRNFFQSDSDWKQFTLLVERKVIEPK